MLARESAPASPTNLRRPNSSLGHKAPAASFNDRIATGNRTLLSTRMPRAQDGAITPRQAEASSSNKSSLDRTYRNCSQLWDVGVTMGFELVSSVANNLCEILDAIAAGAAYERDMIDCHIDSLLLARTTPYRHLSPEQVPEMVSGLRRVVEIASIPPAPNNE